MTDNEIRGLIGYVFERMSVTRCGGTLQHARRFCRDNGIDEAEMVAFLESHGGYCDCEVLMNVGPKLEERLRA